MTIRDRFLKDWKNNFEEGSLPELKILTTVENDGGGITKELHELQVDGDVPVLNLLQEDLEHTHELIFKIRNELKKAKFCQAWLQTEFTRCRKRSESVTPTGTPSASDDDLDTADDEVEEEQEEDDSDDGEPLYMNPQDMNQLAGDDVVVEEDTDSEHDYEYLYDNAPFMNNNSTRMPPAVTARKSPPVKPRRPAPAVPLRQGSLNGNASSVVNRNASPEVSPPLSPMSMERTFSIDYPDATTTERLCRPTLGIPAGVSVMPHSYIEKSNRKRYSTRYEDLTLIGQKPNSDHGDGGAFSSADSVSLSPSVSSSEDKDQVHFRSSPDYEQCELLPQEILHDVRRPSDITLEMHDDSSNVSRSSSIASEPPEGMHMGVRLSTPEVEALNIRRLLLNGILESEKKYIKCMEELLKMMRGIKANIQTTQPILTAENYEIIFFKIPELCEIHRQFCNHMEPKLAVWNTHQTYGDSFKLLASNFGVHEEYVANYKKSMDVIQRVKQENEQFKALAQQHVKLDTGEMVTLEAMLHSPLQRITKLTLVLDDLLKRTPKSHEDYSILYQVHEKTKKFMAQVDQATRDVNPNIKLKRNMLKQSYLVEFIEGDRKLRHVLLYSDLIVCAKEKTSSGMFQSRGQYDCQWYIPITDLSLTPNESSEAEPKVTQLSQSELDALKKEISELKASIRRDTNPNIQKQTRQLQKNVEKNKKNLAQLEAQLIIESPGLSFHLYHHQGKTYTLLMSSDYERSDWKEAILSAKRECRTTPNLTPYHIEKMMGKIKRGSHINAVGSMLIKDDNELFFGQFHLTVHQARGLPVPSQLYCCIEVDAFGLFFLRAKTKTSQNATTPTWEQTFDFEVDGAQKIRILVYDYTKGLDDEMYDKGALQLERSKLSSQDQRLTIKMDRIEVDVSLRFERQEKALKRVMSKKKQGVFGVRIGQLARREQCKIPHVIMKCVEEVEKRGMDEMGIYRISGSSGDINALKRAFELNHVKKLNNLMRTTDIHAIAGLLKLYFRELPEPLFTHNLYEKLVDGIGLSDPDAKNKCMMELLKSVPDVNRHCIFHIFNHLRRVASYASQNKMSLHNLSTVFGPTLLGPAVMAHNADVSLMNILGMSDVMSQVGILHYYLEHFAKEGKLTPKRVAPQPMSTDL